MQDADLFMELAGIAGVFVGFGALIAVRSGGAGDPYEVGYMRGVVSGGLLAIVAALAPVTFGRYHLSEHGIWAVSGVVILAGLVVMVAINVLTSEWRADVASGATLWLPRWLVVVGMATVGLLLLGTVLASSVILVGVAPDLEGALYFTAVVLILLLDAWWLLQLVFRGRPRASA